MFQFDDFFTFLNLEVEELKIENTRLKRDLKSWQEIKDDNDDLTQLQTENGRLKSELKRLKNMAFAGEIQEVVDVENDKYKEELRKSNFVNMKLRSELEEIKNENTQLRCELASFEEIKDNYDDFAQLQIENGRLKHELKRLKNMADDDEVIEVENDKNEEGLRKSNAGKGLKKNNQKCLLFEFSRILVIFLLLQNNTTYSWEI